MKGFGNKRQSRIKPHLMSQQGVGLVEVMVSLLILAVAVLGFTALQSNTTYATAESQIQANSLGIARELGDLMRLNPSAMQNYRDSFTAFDNSFKTNNGNVNPPARNCIAAVCTPAQLAAFDSFNVTRKAYDNGYRIRTFQCPGTAGGRSSAETECVIVSWEDTNPTSGSDANADCLTANGTYHPKSRCVMMELI